MKWSVFPKTFIFILFLQVMQFSIHAQFNNYQAIVVTNVSHTFVVFSYICGDIQWSVLGRNKAAVVGFNAGGKYFVNHPLSGYAGVGDAVSCTFDLGKRRKRQITLVNNVGMQLPADKEKVERFEKCNTASEDDKELLNAAQLNVTVLAQMLDPCPCTRRQAIMDRGRFRNQDNITQDCYVSTNPVELDLYFTRSNLTQQCCYDNSG